MEPLTQRQILRLARMIIEELAKRQTAQHRHIAGHIDQVIEQVRRLSSLRRQLAMAADRGWNAATGKIIEDLRDCIRDIPYHSAEADRAIDDVKPQEVALGDVVAELRQCQNEFDGLQYTPDGTCLSITTDSIELEDVYLGEFQIALDISRLSQVRHDATYRIIALDPHPASSNSDVTHPHVSGEHMCEGDAAAAIGAALASGRVFDFFSLVKGVLTTYNSSSPYVSLSDWDGVSCHECGYTTSQDNLHYCESCDNDLCDECMSYCRQCDDSVCRSCLEECGACGEQICSSCKTKCPDCGRVICKSCLEQQECPCIEERKEQEQDDSESDDQPTQAAGAGTACKAPTEAA
jgi:hypothetical protein